LPGKALSEAGDCLSEPGWDELADSLGRMARLLHGTTPPGAPLFPDSWPPFVGFLARQRAACVENQRRWGSLPAHLVDQIQDYLLPAERLIEAGREPHLVHADLTGDHLLGWVTDGRWSTSGLIDFGDALSGSLFYELPALYFNLLRGSPRRLAQFMQAYRPEADAWRDFVPRAMTAALLHRFDVFADLFLYRPELAGADSLQSLAAELWRLPEVGA
ncbi:MAG: phosphotransferase, partial [Chloroflexi bacterium]|nr:phosphotransferase [Chloroflexota bacterium]